MIISHNINLNVYDRKGRQPIHLAAFKCVSSPSFPPLAPPRLTPFPCLNDACFHSTPTPFPLYNTSGHVDALQLLVNNGAKADVVDKEGRSALFWAAQQGASTLRHALPVAPAPLTLTSIRRRLFFQATTKLSRC